MNDALTDDQVAYLHERAAERREIWEQHRLGESRLPMAKIGDIVERTGAKSKYRFGIVTGFCPDGRQMHVKVTDLQSRTWQPEETRVVGPFVDGSKSPALKCRCCGTSAEVILKWREWLREPDTVLCWSCRYDHFKDGGDAFKEVRIGCGDAGS